MLAACCNEFSSTWLLRENVALLCAITVIDVVACLVVCRVMHLSVHVTCIVSDL